MKGFRSIFFVHCISVEAGSKNLLGNFLGVSNRRYGITPVVPCTNSYPGPPGWRPQYPHPIQKVVDDFGH